MEESNQTTPKKLDNCFILKTIIERMASFQLVLITQKLKKAIDDIESSNTIAYFDLSTFLGTALSESINAMYKKLEAFPFDTDSEITEVSKGIMEFYDTSMDTHAKQIEVVTGAKQDTELFYSQVRAEIMIGDAVLRDLLKKRKKENSYTMFVVSGIIALLSAIIGGLVAK